jgi:hypothetical protein
MLQTEAYLTIVIYDCKTIIEQATGRPRYFKGRHDIQHDDTQHDDTQHDDTQHNDIHNNDSQHKGPICNTQHKSIRAIILSVIMLNVLFYLLLC